MAPLRDDLQQQTTIIFVIKLLLTMVSATLQLYVVVFLQLTFQYQALKQQASEAIQDRNYALHRFRHLRNRYLRKKKRNWKNPGRTENWWIFMLCGQMLPEEWLMTFRMSSKDFFNLEELLRLHIKPRQNSFRGETISSFKKQSMTIYYTKDAGSLRMTSNAFGVGLSTVSKSIRQVFRVIVTVLGPQLIEFPTRAEGLKELIQRFESKFGFPMVNGYIDVTHIPIKQPNENAHDYFCYKMKYIY